MITIRTLLAPLAGLLLAPLVLAAPDASADADLAVRVRRALTSDLNGRLVSDEQLTARVHGRSDLDLAREAAAVIRQELGSRLSGLTVSAQDGVIELRGKARDPAAARRAAELAARIEGAAGVRSTLDGGSRIDATPDPEAPFSFATDDLLGGRGLRVHVASGLVRLTGTVNGPAARNHALRAARSVRGVREVVDELDIREPPVREEAGTLGILRWRLSNLPELQPLVDDIDLTLRAGVVRVSGKVDDELHRDLIEVTLLSSRSVLCVVSDVELSGGDERPAPRID